jgi:transposase-like protein
MDADYTERIEALRLEAAERETLQYPADFRDQAVALVDELRADGWTQKAVSEALDICWQTLRRWRNQDPDGDEGFRAVDVAARPAAEPRLVSPSGWRIEGLSVEELVDVARRLS